MGRWSARLLAGLTIPVVFLCAPPDAHASLLSPELEDKLATFIALFVIFVVPVVLIALFWMVHILPEKIAHKRHHPQFEAIRTLCLLSLVFGGLLWPLAWLWAYSKPVLYKLAYGTDKASPTGDGDVEHETARVATASRSDRAAGDAGAAVRARRPARRPRGARSEVRPARGPGRWKSSCSASTRSSSG